MQEQDKHSIHYSTADIQKYLEGKLSVQEMHAIEKAALEDPFLADAIEGIRNDFEKRRSTEFNNDLTELKENLINRVAKKEKIIILWTKRIWPRVAAAAVILIGSVFLIYNYLIKDFAENKKSIAKETIASDSSMKPGSSTSAKTDSINIENTVAGNQIKKENKDQKKEILKNNEVAKNETKKENEPIASDSSVYKQPANHPVAKNEEKNRNTIQADTLQQISATAAPATVENSLQSKAAGVTVQRAKFSKSTNKNFFSGRVTDENKNPIPGASVMFKNKKTATVTDQNGNFKLNNSGNDSSTNVVVNSVGFQPALFTLSNNNIASNQIQLKPATSALSEVVVVGYGSQSDKKIADSADDDKDDDEAFTADDISFDALPVIGWVAYNDYINRNKKISTADSTIKGKEIISFIVDKNNQLSSFKIKNSLSKAHDAEALRLIKQGPAWKLLKGKKEKITLAVEF